MLRILSLAGGLAGAVGLSQFPEFSQQYLQRLAGHVDALTVVALDFDRSALASGLGREEALLQMTGTAFLSERQADMRRTFARHARLTQDLAELRAASPMARLTMPHRFADRETLARTWADFVPAVPASTAGLASAGVGFAGGWALLGAAMGLVAWPLRRVLVGLRRRKAEQAAGSIRRDPPISRPPRPTLVLHTAQHKPLMGETR